MSDLPETKTRHQEWEISTESNIASDFKKHFDKYPEHTKLLTEFESDVTKNPFNHPVKKRIRKIQRKDRYPEGTHRWSKKRLRVVYLPVEESHTVYPLDVGLDKDIKYKRK